MLGVGLTCDTEAAIAVPVSILHGQQKFPSAFYEILTAKIFLHVIFGSLIGKKKIVCLT